ncbi:DUF2950 domain-containing protein [Paraburkholderia sp. FT54]|uniref:DUF2950 domain-containing protein n=1 Tax=Paraburkholderia sp. FT54 TaxID=3074437 RepID=UPI00287756E2|nr:DUF2950 domain-containing protein [Paraburkholderia sp. FT54]WNC94454.1 DUF2950 domain-containing protein [Paraburkholderia sp. FT54]
MKGLPRIRIALARSGSWVTVLLAFGLASMPAMSAQKFFQTPEAAMNAFGTAVANNDQQELRALLGADFRQVIPPVGAEIRDKFLSEWQTSHSIQPIDNDDARIAVGTEGWTLPIPLLKTSQGWRFDMRAGADEMRVRRIGRNELAVIQTMLAICDAQREYVSTYHDGRNLYLYADKFESSPGKHDGLYWPTTAPDEAPSPLGPAFMSAGARNAAQSGYYGYHYKLLRAQGPNAPGGAYDYMVNGRLYGGFAVIAWPARYGATGIKSFTVSHDGQVYERDLGRDSAKKAEAMTSFNPGPGWDKVSP